MLQFPASVQYRVLFRESNRGSAQSVYRLEFAPNCGASSAGKNRTFMAQYRGEGSRVPFVTVFRHIVDISTVACPPVVE